MFTKGKYVIGELPQIVGSNLGAVIVSEAFGHDVAARCFLPGTIRSAGFFHVTQDKDGEGYLCLKVVTYGESVGLQVKSDPKDQRLVAQALGL